jgi:hypothetical protein
MNIFEITELLEKVSPKDLAKIKAALKAYASFSTAGSPEKTDGEVTGKLDGKDGDVAAGNKAANMREFVKNNIEAVRSGQSKLNKDIDAELGKRGADPQKIHIKIINKTRKAGAQLFTAAAKDYKPSSAKRRALKGTIDLRIREAAFGYINKKYLGGDDKNFKFNTLELVTKALKSQAPKGGNQPIGKVSSSRAPGAQGTVSSGGGTNALDTMAAQDF